jgi:hypothetical protein
MEPPKSARTFSADGAVAVRGPPREGLIVRVKDVTLD